MVSFAPIVLNRAQRPRHWRTCLYRLVGLLLLFTCVDILSPQTCAEDMLGFSAGGASISATASVPSAAASNSAANPSFEAALDSRMAAIQATPLHSDDNNASEHADEDCFCCCSHLVASGRITLQAVPAQVMSGSPTPFSMSVGTTQSLFRPPRLL